MLSDETVSLRHLQRRSSKNCDLQFANSDRFKANYSVDVNSEILNQYTNMKNISICLCLLILLSYMAFCFFFPFCCPITALIVPHLLSFHRVIVTFSSSACTGHTQQIEYSVSNVINKYTVLNTTQ